MPEPSETTDRKKRLRPKIYAIGIYVVAFFFVLQISLLVWFFLMRQRLILETEGPTLQAQPAIVVTDTASMPSLPITNIPSARLPVDKVLPMETEIVRLNGEAQNFRRNGDFAMAEAALKKAQTLDAVHPLTLTNLAMLEEAQGRNIRALDYWKQVIALGDRARDTIQLARERSVIIEERLRLEDEARRSDSARASSRRLNIERIETQPDPMPENPAEIQRDFVLKSVAEGEAVQASKVRVQVYFYDRIGTDRLVSIPIEARFLNQSPDWSLRNEEVLRVRYVATKSTGEPRRYYGYVFRIFYDGILQEERAEPATLLRLNPAR
jgi:tetratricopeptide (TPR) repeat protein